jgi:hypothetical protein
VDWKLEEQELKKLNLLMKAREGQAEIKKYLKMMMVRRYWAARVMFGERKLETVDHEEPTSSI